MIYEKGDIKRTDFSIFSIEVLESPKNKINLEEYSIHHNESMNLHRRLQTLKTLPNEIITNKIDYMEQIRNSFKNPELIKLKALQTFDKINKNTINYKLYNEKRTLENQKRFIIPPLQLKKIDEKKFLIKKIMEKNEKSNILQKHKKTLSFRTSRGVPNEENSFAKEFAKDIKIESKHKRVFSLNPLHTELLPLKYSANKIKKNKGKIDFFN